MTLLSNPGAVRSDLTRLEITPSAIGAYFVLLLQMESTLQGALSRYQETPAPASMVCQSRTCNSEHLQDHMILERQSLKHFSRPFQDTCIFLGLPPRIYFSTNELSGALLLTLRP